MMGGVECPLKNSLHSFHTSRVLDDGWSRVSTQKLLTLFRNTLFISRILELQVYFRNYKELHSLFPELQTGIINSLFTKLQRIANSLFTKLQGGMEWSVN